MVFGLHVGVYSKTIQWHTHAGSWSLVNCWREGSTLPYKGCSWILMNAAVGLMDGLGLDGDRCIRVIPRQWWQKSKVTCNRSLYTSKRGFSIQITSSVTLMISKELHIKSSRQFHMQSINPNAFICNLNLFLIQLNWKWSRKKTGLTMILIRNLSFCPHPCFYSHLCRSELQINRLHFRYNFCWYQSILKCKSFFHLSRSRSISS